MITRRDVRTEDEGHLFPLLVPDGNEIIGQVAPAPCVEYRGRLNPQRECGLGRVDLNRAGAWSGWSVFLVHSRDAHWDELGRCWFDIQPALPVQLAPVET